MKAYQKLPQSCGHSNIQLSLSYSQTDSKVSSNYCKPVAKVWANFFLKKSSNRHEVGKCQDQAMIGLGSIKRKSLLGTLTMTSTIADTWWGRRFYWGWLWTLSTIINNITNTDTRWERNVDYDCDYMTMLTMTLTITDTRWGRMWGSTARVRRPCRPPTSPGTSTSSRWVIIV